MYILEKLIKLITKFSHKELIYNTPTDEDNYELEDVIKCNHNFLPIDSTGEVFACSKCGYLVTRKRLEQNNNFFKNQ